MMNFRNLLKLFLVISIIAYLVIDVFSNYRFSNGIAIKIFHLFPNKEIRLKDMTIRFPAYFYHSFESGGVFLTLRIKENPSIYIKKDAKWSLNDISIKELEEYLRTNSKQFNHKKIRVGKEPATILSTCNYVKDKSCSAYVIIPTKMFMISYSGMPSDFDEFRLILEKVKFVHN